MTIKNSYSYDELIECGQGKMFGPGNAQLPLPPMLMFDRIIEINDNQGEFNKGFIHAEMDINPDLWFFKCHFENDPVMPGCLGLEDRREGGRKPCRFLALFPRRWPSTALFRCGPLES